MGWFWKSGGAHANSNANLCAAVTINPEDIASGVVEVHVCPPYFRLLMNKISDWICDSFRMPL